MDQTTTPPPPPPMFACIIPSRPIQTQSTTIPPDKIIFEFDEPNQINHLVVFLTGAIPFPDGYGASVHFLFPNQSEWKLLGMLSEDKPSAIFRLKGNQTSNFNHHHHPSISINSKASLGLQLSPIEEIQRECSKSNQLIKLTSTTSPSIDFNSPQSIEFIKSLGSNLFNYLASFSVQLPGQIGQWINFIHLEKWYKTFQNQSFNLFKP
ncbi:hypothetical protein DFH28DRAFT_1085140 [Melampsora americana]|nr:hypothetical protein DFH28DRAFT_1085140 [Melampsora americana]